jgi:cytidylate kinase
MRVVEGEGMRRLVIAIDGPAASGKTTTARLVAAKLGYLLVDTGAMYRALALKSLREGIGPSDAAGLEALARSTEVTLEPRSDGARVFLDGREVTGEIRTPDVSERASRIAEHPGVRARMVELQRALGASGGVVVEGRDIGTVVFPDADVKVYLVASSGERAERRRKDLAEAGREPPAVADVLADIDARDRRDSNRAVSPLRKAEGAVEIDTTSLGIEEQVEAVLGIVRRIHSEIP